MRPALPNFENTTCRYMHVCALGNPEGDAKAYLESLEEEMVAGYNTAAGRALIRFVVLDKDPPHFHIDIALARYFLKGRPKSTHRKAQILRVLAGLSRHDWRSKPTALFFTRRDIGKLFYAGLGTKLDFDDKAEISLTGVELTFKKTHLGQLSATLYGKMAMVEMEGIRSARAIGADFLTAPMETFGDYYLAFTGGKEE